MVVQDTKEIVVLRGLFIGLEVSVCRRFTVVIDERLDISRNSRVQLAEMLSRDVIIVLVWIAIHHTTAKKPQSHFVDGVVCRDNQHQVVDVGLCVSACRSDTAFNIVGGNHTRINSGVTVIDALHVTGGEPCNNQRYHGQDDQVPAYLI